jgi:hypothetical protein
MTDTTTYKTQAQRVLEALKTGQELTAKQISARFKVASPSKVVSTLRFSGYPIYLNEHKDTKGRVTNKYRLGTASRKIIAAGYKALATGM